MQKTRQRILNYLRLNGEATVDELSRALDNLTAVTVRHHLDVLRSEGLVALPEIRHRDTPGRPKYVYSLTEKARELFPRNLETLTIHLLDELKSSLPPQQINVILQGLAERMAAEGNGVLESETIETRLERVTEHLNQHGYGAYWEAHPDGYVLRTTSCPYMGVSDVHQELCMVDMQYISRLLGVTPHRLSHRREGARNCSFLIAASEVPTAN